MALKYFFDSYAIIELEKGNPDYFKFKDEIITITVFNLAEIYWSFLNDVGKMADKLYESYKRCVVMIPDSVLKEAIKFRKNNKSKNLSYADCIGYMYALKNNLIFLTGDKEFKDLKNVEFVK